MSAAILGERGQVILTFALAIAFYLAPGWLGLILLLALAGAISWRPDLGLALVAFSLSFFQAPKQLPLVGGISPVELALALTLMAFAWHSLLRWKIQRLTFNVQSLRSTDYAALTLVALGFAATLAAPNFGVSLREWRVVVLESVIFYFLVRLGLDFNPLPNFHFPISTPHSPTWAWRLIDAFVAGAVLQAAIALYLYFFTDQSITAEGVRRALGLAYGSPNNLSLFLDRAWPILLAVIIWPGNLDFSSVPSSSYTLRRWLYGVGLLIVSVALYLTFSKGALLLGLPASVLAMALIYAQRSRAERRHWRPVLIAAGGGLAILALALIPLSQTERFRTTFDLTPGSTGFFRLKLWQASLNMLRDHWPLGVGLDNFLYQYRTRYILPEAWQEPNLSHPHNLILDFGTRLGIGGIVLLLWLQVAFWRNAWRLYQKSPGPLTLGLMGSMLVILAHGLVDNSYFLVDLAFVFSLIVGIVQRLAEEAKYYPHSSE
jgi:O-antigen ligase